MNETMDTVTLLLDNDESVECAILCILPVQGKDYIALLPLDDEGDTEEESRVFLYRYIEHEDGEPELENIEDDEEFDVVADAYDEWLDTQEYEELDLDALGLDSLE
ncbi:DUF1292 domain-containing protein [Mediterraneibacter agrestimuris]|uniref:DUF1292 domain-containing protein n=1 Tax=Mediterraneibacter agrestimuris TaxID=2941333 RepID=UPI00203B7D70|nr:DUF1292 domain-containing protein [Mediterraneibacter agrestimuris]